MTPYQLSCQRKRLEGLTFSEIAELWHDQQKGVKSGSGKPLTTRQIFCREKRKEGLSKGQIAELWRREKAT